jgi:hypothetical protein
VLDRPHAEYGGAGLGAGPAPGGPDIDAARAELVGRGTDVGEVFHFESGKRVPGPDPQRSDWGSFLTFSDPDGNSWMVVEAGRAEPGKT